MNYALIPAGGHSTRMGRPKLSLPLGDRTVLEHVVAALRQATVENILVVVGVHAPELVPLAKRSGADVLLLSEETLDMRATVERGLLGLEERFRPSDEDNWLLVPADHPTIDAYTVQQLLLARTGQPDRTIVVPTNRGRRGHPVLIAWKHVAGIRELPAGLGLNAYLRQHLVETQETPVESEAILVDLDTPEDYQRLLREYSPASPGRQRNAASPE